MDNAGSLVSIIIVNFNGKIYLKSCFDSLLEGTCKNIEIIFVDNASSDGSSEFVRKFYPHIRIIDNKSNLGLSVASNIAAMASQGKYLFFYNNDTIADRLLIEKLLAGMEQDSLVGICGCRTYTYDGKRIINEGVSCDIFGYPYGKTEPFYVDAAIFIRRDLFWKLGGFDEGMFLYGEDRDICWRCWLYGYKVRVIKEARFSHASACITNSIKEYRTNINKRFLSEFNALRSILKNYSAPFLLFIVPAHLAFHMLEMIAFLLEGKTVVVKNVYIKAYKENLKDIHNIFKARAVIQRERKISDFQLLGHMDKILGKIRLFFDMGIPPVDISTRYEK